MLDPLPQLLCCGCVGGKAAVLGAQWVLGTHEQGPVSGGSEIPWGRDPCGFWGGNAEFGVSP